MFNPKARVCPRVIAHRGGGLMRPENSWEAFEFCAAEGFDYVETDAQLSADGEVFLLHDPVLERVSDGRGAVGNLSGEELRALTLHGSRRGPVPLTEALAQFPDTAFNIDAKSDAVVQPLLDAITAAGAQGRVLLASFSSARLRKIRRLYPNIATSLGESEIASLVATSRLPERSWLHLPWHRAALQSDTRAGRPVAVQVPLSYRGIPIVTQRFVALSHYLGYHVHVWTLNDAQQVHLALDRGADAIITDDPTMARSILKSRRS